MNTYDKLAKMADLNRSSSVKWRKTSVACHHCIVDGVKIEIHRYARSVRFNNGEWHKMLLLNDKLTVYEVKAAALREYERRYK